LPQLSTSDVKGVALHLAASQGSAGLSQQALARSQEALGKTAAGPANTKPMKSQDKMESNLDKNKSSPLGEKVTQVKGLTRHLPPLQGATRTPPKEFPEDDMPTTVNV
jgi:hypothetical protein